MVNRHTSCKLNAPLQSQGGWVLRGFGKMILVFTCIAVVLFLLASTSFLSDFILKNMMKFPVEVNPVAAAVHQNSNHDVMSSASAVYDMKVESGVDSKVDPKTDSKNKPMGHKKHRSIDEQMSPDISVLSPPSADESAIARVLDNIPDQKLDLVALSPRPVLDSSNKAGAQAIVVLGGGLTRDRSGQITPNSFTRMRLLQAISQHRSTKLPILLTGVESRYMQKFLNEQGETAQWLESSSMNTCENARFSALLLQRLGGAPRVELVTDKWHIPRARWLFAMNGIETVPIPAALPGDPAPWWPDSRNLTHTRRAVYELVAFTRDRWFGVVGCREVP